MGNEPVKNISLALQGGGAHGAFAWGVLDRLLEDGRHRHRGRQRHQRRRHERRGARLRPGRGRPRGRARGAADFWRARRAMRRGASAAAAVAARPADAGDHWRSEFSRLPCRSTIADARVSPYQLNPAQLQSAARRARAVGRLRAAAQRGPPCKLFLCATNVRTGKVRVFTDAEISADAVLASACLPFMFQAVEIDGEPYWDGGYHGQSRHLSR